MKDYLQGPSVIALFNGGVELDMVTSARDDDVAGNAGLRVEFPSSVVFLGNCEFESHWVMTPLPSAGGGQHHLMNLIGSVCDSNVSAEAQLLRILGSLRFPQG